VKAKKILQIRDKNYFRGAKKYLEIKKKSGIYSKDQKNLDKFLK